MIPSGKNSLSVKMIISRHKLLHDIVIIIATDTMEVATSDGPTQGDKTIESIG